MLAATLLAAVFAAELGSLESVGENPIRRIVTLLQKMQTEVNDEGARDKDLHEKFTCYCQKNDGALSAGLEELRAKIPEIESSITEAESLKQQLADELAQHKTDRQNAKESVSAATERRAKEAEEFAAESSELKANINACQRASDAIAKGMAAMFLQSGAASTLRRFVLSHAKMDRYSRETLTAFLSTSSEYAPASGEIVGILRQLEEDMHADLKATTEAENAAIAEFEGLVAAKNKEIQAATEAIESKTERAGETAVQIVSLKNDLEDTKDSLGADETFLMELKKSCATGGTEYEERLQLRSEEVAAISATIQILNDDDSLDLFKKTLPSPSLLQMTRRARDVRKEALAKIRGITKLPALNFITLALEGKKVGFEKVIKLIDDLVTKLGTEQEDDEAQRKWCNAEFDTSEDNEKDLKRRLEGLATRIEETTQAIATLKDELAALDQGIKDLDSQVAEATSQRQSENKAFTQTAAENNAAVQLLGVAKNKLNKFYNPALYKAPQRRELTEEERIFVNSGGVDPRDAEEAAADKGIAGTGIAVFAQVRLADSVEDKPAPAPETGSYERKDSSGPLALIDTLKNDLEKDMLANERDEAQAQKDYEEFMGDSVAKRQADSRTITEKFSQKAELEADLQAAKDGHTSATAEFAALGEYIAKLHGSCDFLLDNFDLRKDARANEVDALKRAKAVLSGADYSLVQVRSFLGRS